MQEDDILVDLVKEFGEQNWTELAAAMQERYRIDGRSGKQCRERWRNNLDPSVNKAPWSDEEQRVLEEAHSRLGNRWVEIAKLLPGRTDNCVKNRFYGSVRKKQRAKQRPSSAVTTPAQSSETTVEEVPAVKSSQEAGVKRGHSGFTPTRNMQRKLKILSPRPALSLPENLTPSQ